MPFGVTDHVDSSGIAPADQLEQRLQRVEVFDELGFDRYMLTEHHGTPLNLVPSPHLFLAAASQRTTRIQLGSLPRCCPSTTRSG
jgi:alkanesulfonate monooxygenase SsuD/methylene tetrahydromethanopterin reductase-like flavin-dependent oxidoreductase (luciferase family)